MKTKRAADYSAIVKLDTAGETPSEEYDVFLNFRGTDTRYGFVDCLYEFMTSAGIRVFMDDEALRIGDDIGDQLVKAIDSSRLYVPVFSRNYASSKWCLIELAQMVENCTRESDSKEILPVFFDVEPEDVKLKSELYASELLQHEAICGQDTVETWRKALRKIPKLKGWNLKSNQGQGKLIRQIAEHLSQRLDLKYRILPDHLIGIKEQVEDIINTLDLGSRDVSIMVIHGIGGIGKTTLASAVFNKNVCNFKKKLLRDIIRLSPPKFYDENDAMNRIRASLRKRNVLVVLDDVSHVDQIRKLVGMGDWVGLASRVIITTRNLNCIASSDEIENDIRILQGKKIYVYRMRELDFDHSLQLLCWNAFGNDVPPHGYEQLSCVMLSFTRGVPLALEVVGSRLRGKGMAIWKETMKKLKKVPEDRLYQEILMSSYEMLCDGTKDIFLDIAFFLADHDKTIACYYWEACGLFPETSIDALVSYALVKIDVANKLRMHDLLRDLGREVVRKQCNGNLEKYSRLCNEDASNLLSRKEFTAEAKALKLDSYHSRDFTPAALLGLSGLKFLELQGGNFVSEFNSWCLPELRWLSLENFSPDFRGTNFYFKNLVVLKLSNSKITDSWAGWEQFKTASSLKVLELEGLHLTTTPDLASLRCLERLEVRNCESLVDIDPSIGNLESLDTLNIGNEQRLSELTRSSHKVLHLPSSICNLKALTRLVIWQLRLEQLPEEIGELKGLKHVAITGCKLLRNLPDSFGNLESLCELFLLSCGITELPKSISKLRNLTALLAGNNRLKGLPATIGELEKLKILDLNGNNNLEGLPDELGNLQSLTCLILSTTGIFGLPASMVQLSCLKSLCLSFCDEIQELPDLPASLISLRILSSSIEGVPNLWSLTNLEDLELVNGGYDGFHPHEPEESLAVDLSRMPLYLSPGLNVLPRLRKLSLSCPNPSALSLLPSGLKSLVMYHSTSVSHWDRLSNLECLSTLELNSSSATEIQLDGLESLKNLTTLIILGCKSLERVYGVSRLRNIQVLRLIDCPKLVEIGGLAQTPDSLEFLLILGCDSIRCLPAQSDTEAPSELHLDVDGCRELRNYSGPYRGYFQEGSNVYQC